MSMPIPPSAEGERLAFETYRRGSLDLYVMSVVGKELRPMTANPAPDSASAWAPEGQAIAFASPRDGSKDIHLAEASEYAHVARRNPARVHLTSWCRSWT
jgi:Tol biopolymer transport system component